MDLCNINEIKALLARHGFHFSKAKGQNFLTQSWVPQNIVLESGVDETCGVLEVGPGIGPLTQQLCRYAKKVVAVEVDRTLQPVLAETMAGNENLEIIFGDILKTDISALVQEEFAGLRPMACANLPYYITTPILMRLLECGYPFDSITVMVQREVADRLCAAPGSADYGAITASLCYYGAPKKLFTVTAGNFMPAPKVDSAVVRIDLWRDKPVKPQSPELFFKVIRAAFGQRRKTLTNALSTAFPELSKDALTAAVTSCGHDARIRGERLSTAEFAALADALLPLLS